MNCIYCSNKSEIVSEDLFKCKLCNLSFKIKNNTIYYLFLYYKNCRLYFAASDSCLFQIVSKDQFKIWNTVTKVDSKILCLPLNKIHQKLDSLISLLPYI